MTVQRSEGSGARLAPPSFSTALVGVFLGLLGLVPLAGCPTGGTTPGRDGGPQDGGPRCEFDDSEDPATAVALSLGQEATGYICPVEDEDWYVFETGAGDHLLTVRLSLDAPIAPIEATYVVYEDVGGQPGEVAARPPAEEVGEDLEIVHCVAPGRYFLVVRDQGDDAQDARHAYRLSVESAPDPDPAEPNDDAAGATAASLGTPVEGAIGCRGDEDWFAVDVGAGQLLSIRLEMPVATLQPTVKVRDGMGNVVATETNPRGTVEATQLSRLVQVPQPGRWYVSVGDDDGRNADPGARYRLTLDLVQDRDANEPNNTSAEATELASQSCGASWSSWQTVTGSFGTLGDLDWFRLPLSGCANGIVEVELELDTSGLSAAEQWALQETVQSSVALVRGHPESACSSDNECADINLPCRSDWDCAGYFNTCLPAGFCAGAATCLPEGHCGANVIERHYQQRTPPMNPTSGPGPNRARFAAPTFGHNVLYLRVSDFQGDGSAPDLDYTLRVRVRTDPDVHEPSNAYAPRIFESDPAGPQIAATLASGNVLPVYDATTGGGCDSTTWTEGSLGYTLDQDWYAYAHPCPGMDCMVRVNYERDGGPVELLFNIYAEDRRFNDLLAGLPESANNAPMSGYLGGTTAADACHYAFQGHTGNPFYYFIQVRDLLDVEDWDPDQKYRLCVEKIADGCAEPPCMLYMNGCGQP